ncbi:MAG: PEP-CTERM sorting domain-containing protein, partial [Phycisphaerae bacterium]
YSVGVAGGSAVQLVSTWSGPGPAPKGVQNGRVATIGSTDIVTAHTSSGVTEFHRVAIDTGASTLMGSVPADTERSLFLRAALHDASGAVFQGLDDSEAMSLWYIPFSGGPALRLTEDMPAVESYPEEYILPHFARCLITPDDRTLVYSIPATDGRELYSVPMSGGASVRLDHDPIAGLSVFEEELTPDGLYVVYSVGEYTGDRGLGNHIKELYAVGVHGGTPWLLNDPLASGQFIAGDYQIGPDGTVVYWAGNDETGYDLYSSAIPEPATLLLICGAAAPVLLKRRRRQ